MIKLWKCQLLSVYIDINYKEAVLHIYAIFYTTTYTSPLSSNNTDICEHVHKSWSFTLKKRILTYCVLVQTGVKPCFNLGNS